jgi:hypothetical protein
MLKLNILEKKNKYSVDDVNYIFVAVVIENVQLREIFVFVDFFCTPFL